MIGELPVFEPLLRRAPIFYAWPVAADVLATAVVLVWCVGALGETALRPLAVLVVPLVLILGKAEQLHAGDQGPRLVHLATLCALLACLLHGWFAAGELGPHHALLLWGAIFALALLRPKLAARRLAWRGVAATRNNGRSDARPPAKERIAATTATLRGLAA